MLQFKNILEKIKTQLFKSYSGDSGKMLLHTATLAWTTSAIAQIFGIATNDKISKDQKKFIIPQEMADAFINILAFYTLTNGIQTFTRWMASSGKVITPKIKKLCEECEIEVGKWSNNIGKDLTKKISDYKDTPEVFKEIKKEIPADVNNVINNRIEKFEELQKIYDPFESGFKIIGNVIGAVVSSNIITPWLRNPIAANKQKQAIAMEHYESMKKSNQINSPVAPMQKSYSLVDNYKSKVMSPTSGSMRV